MLIDVLLAIAHYLLIFALIAILVLEMAHVRPGLSGRQLAFVSGLDMAYGIVALLLLAAGFGRVFFGLKGAEFYLGSHTFWTKIALFILVAILSAPPTMRILSWRRQAAADPNFTPPETEIRRVRKFMHAEATIVFLIPIFAVLMARGIG